MNTYKVQMMSEKNYEKYMSGYMGCIKMKELVVKTEDNAKEIEAYFEAMYPKKAINVIKIK